MNGPRMMAASSVWITPAVLTRKQMSPITGQIGRFDPHASTTSLSSLNALTLKQPELVLNKNYKQVRVSNQNWSRQVKNASL